MVRIPNADRNWEGWGKQDPYYGVLCDPKFSNADLNEDLLQEFFASGERHIDHVYKTIRAKVQPAFQPDRVLDYGCGVGRLVVPLARRSHAVFGVDVSPSMLAQARENCKKFGADSACLLHIDMLNSLALASFDLVHSFIVFQHIPTARGEVILRKLIDLIADGGVGAIHLTFYDPRSALWRILRAFCPRTRLVGGLLNLIQHQPLSRPRMQVNSYSMSRIFKILFDAHCSNLYIEFSDHSGFHGAMIYFERAIRPLL